MPCMEIKISQANVCVHGISDLTMPLLVETIQGSDKYDFPENYSCSVMCRGRNKHWSGGPWPVVFAVGPVKSAIHWPGWPVKF